MVTWSVCIVVHVAPSGPPRDVTAGAISSTAVHVQWNDVLDEDRNGVLIDYEVFTLYTLIEK